MSDQSVVPFREAVSVWFRIGILSFGGPAAQIALMHNVVVQEKRWLSEKNYLSALGFCMMLPGPEAMQLATYIGWRLHGVLGGLAAGILFVMPGALIVLSFAIAYVLVGESSTFAAIFFGIKSAVLAIVLDALIRVGRRSLQSQAHWCLAALGFTSLFFFDLPFPIVILAAAVWGFWRGAEPKSQIDLTTSVPPKFSHVSRTILVWGGLWLAPLLLLWWMTPEHILVDVAAFFSMLAVTTFGGAYAVLAYMAQEAVNSQGWLTAGQMMDGLGLAETTPGPLILVTEFVGFMAGFSIGGVTLGILSAFITLWVTFVPCFLWIFAGAPYIELIASRPSLAGALSGITAAVVGVILNLSLWFGLHVLFTDIVRIDYGFLGIWTPELNSFDGRAAFLVISAGILLFCFKQNVLRVLLAATTVSAALSFFA
ncbi:MAG: chromate efflux transporter [Rhodospirillales bacterium]